MDKQRFGRWQLASWWRRTALFGVAVLQTWVALEYLLKILPKHGETPLELAIASLFVVLFGWISLGFWTAAAGFMVLLFRRDKYAISRLEGAAGPNASMAKTAIVIPICNEDTARVFAGLRTTYRSLKQTGQLSHFEFFIISDSSDPDVWVEEERAWALWCREEADHERIHYRIRHTKIKRKTGNLADFCRRWSGDFRYMIVFDADSFMSGATMVKMVRLMEARREVGIIQTSPLTVNRESLYARVQQFGNHLYGPLFTAGLNFWQMGDGYYWGHNAIIRMQPFVEHCALGRLSDSLPMGGEILSHDFVEAAYMRRAGWEVWLAYDLEGSFEEPPPTLLDELKRDRRWSQGNLQHLRLIFSRGLSNVHRVMFFYGMMAYGSALFWLIMLGLSTAELAEKSQHTPEYFPDSPTLFPIWPIFRAEWVWGLLGTTAVLLFMPKIMALFLAMISGEKRRQYGGFFGLTGSVLIESIVSMLLAPVRMLFHSKYVFLTLIGIEAGWGTQQRDDNQTRWSEAFAHHGTGAALGLTWGVIVFYLDPSYLPWMLPILGALVIAPAVSVYTSRVSLGQRFARLRLLLTPSETQPVQEIQTLESLLQQTENRPNSGFEMAVVDPLVNALHLSLLPKRHVTAKHTHKALLALREKAFQHGPSSLSTKEKHLLLRDAQGMHWLHQQLWRSVDNRIRQHWPGLPSLPETPDTRLSA